MIDSVIASIKIIKITNLSSFHLSTCLNRYVHAVVLLTVNLNITTIHYSSTHLITHMQKLGETPL